MKRFQVAASDEETARLEAVKERHQWQMLQAVMFWRVMEARRNNPYRNTVRPGVKAKRRAKNRAARKARRLNRGK